MSALIGQENLAAVRDGQTETSDLEEILDLMVYEDQLDVHYQPIFSAETGCIVGVEALLRQIDSRNGPSSAERLIRMAELSGQIVDIGNWVIDQVCSQINKWVPMVDDPGFSVSVNLSPVELANEVLAARLLERIADKGVEPGRLNIELTESAAIGNIERVRYGLAQLREAGVSVSLDDFGTGMSALAYLYELPLDSIKIDRRFVACFGRDERPEQVVRHICGLAASLDLHTVAEGIETRSQWERVIASGCDQGQGYFLSPPVAAQAIDEILRGHSEWSVWSRGQRTLWAS